MGLRAMVRDRGATMMAIASIALGIAATTAMFSVVYAVIIDPFPYKDIDSLASIKVWEPGARGFRTGYTVDQYLELRDAARHDRHRAAGYDSGRVGDCDERPGAGVQRC